MPIRLTILAVTLATAPVTAAPPVHQAAVGSAERKAVLEALRPAIEAKFKVPIEFTKASVCVLDDAALVLAEPQRKGGGPAPWRNVMPKDEYDTTGDQVSGVLRVRNGRWNLVASEIGATDVWYQGLLPRVLIANC